MDVEEMRLWYHRPRVVRVVHILRWVILFGVLAAFFGWFFSCVASGGCAPNPPELKSSDLTAALVTVTHPAEGGPPKKIQIDLSNPSERSQLLDAYRSMTKWRQEGSSRLPSSPNHTLELRLKNGERIVVLVETADYPELFVLKYKGEKLKSTVEADAGKMREYLSAKGE